MSLFVDCNKPLIDKLDDHAQSQETLNMETEFCSVSLDIIGRAVFNYNFRSVTTESPVVKAVYRALQEVCILYVYIHLIKMYFIKYIFIFILFYITIKLNNICTLYTSILSNYIHYIHSFSFCSI